MLRDEWCVSRLQHLIVSVDPDLQHPNSVLRHYAADPFLRNLEADRLGSAATPAQQEQAAEYVAHVQRRQPVAEAQEVGDEPVQPPEAPPLVVVAGDAQRGCEPPEVAGASAVPARRSAQRPPRAAATTRVGERRRGGHEVVVVARRGLRFLTVLGAPLRHFPEQVASFSFHCEKGWWGSSHGTTVAQFPCLVSTAA